MLLASPCAGAQSLSAAWQPLGPVQVTTAGYGRVTGRVSTIAVDPTDTTGNTLYLGTTGGGVWKTTNARAAAGSVTFSPLTDTLPVFNAGAGSTATPSLTIGAIATANNVVLAGTGDPNGAADSFYGEGILRSADAGLTWTQIRLSNDGTYGNHSFAGLAFAGVAWSSTTPGTVVAAVTDAAESALVGATSATSSVMGLYVSSDYGATWQMATVMDGSTYVQRPLLSGGNHGGNAATSVAWNPVRRRFYAAVRYHGYYESADGLTWTRLAAQPGTGLTTAACPSNTDQVGSASCPIDRGVVAVEPTSGDTYALTVDANNLDQGLWRDACSASGGACAGSVSFAQRLGGTSLQSTGSTAIAQGRYNLALTAVASASDTLVFAGTVDLYRCALSSGCATLRNTTNTQNGCSAPAQVAPAQHALATVTTSGAPTLFVGNDGGLWRSTDGVNQQATPCSADDAAHFDNLNAALGSLAMVHSLAQHPSDAATLLAGMGANGTAATTTAASSTPAWTQLSAGEGGAVAIDPANANNWYLTTGTGVSIRRCGNGGACTAADFTGAPTLGSAQVAGDLTLTHTPWLLDPALSGNVVLGTCRVWRGPADNGSAWSVANAIAAMFSGTQATACVAGNGLVTSLAAGGATAASSNAQNAGSKVIYAGMAGVLTGGGATAGGHLFVTRAADTASSTTTWADAATAPVTTNGTTTSFNPSGYDVSSVFVDPHDATGATVYATIRGFGVPHLYRSTDAGASWTNITRNLPDLPANAVVVDPNDANTVYVGLDSGVWVTTAVTTCASANCWSVLGTALPNTPVTALLAGAALPTGDGRLGMLRVATYGRGVWQTPLLAATTPAAAPAITLTPTALGFGTQQVSTASGAQSVTLTNSGNAALTVSSITISQAQLPLGPATEFSESDSCVAAPIAAGASCTIQVRFTPAAAGARTATMTIYANVSGGQATVALSGTATSAGAAVLTPTSLTFPATAVNTTSAAQNITVANTGSGSVALGAPAVSGDFALSANSCGASLAAQTSCTLSITLTPTASGARSGGLSLTADGTTLSAALAGTGLLPATDALAPTALAFAAQPLGTTSAGQLVTVTNTGDVALTLISTTTTGDFATTSGCGASLAAHASCAITVVFQPKQLGPEVGTLVVRDQYRAQTVALAGTGIAPAGVSIAPLYAMSFPATGLGLSAAPQAVTVTNNGGAALAISSFSVTGDFSVLAGSNTCTATLPVGAACTMQLLFTPTATGARSGTLQLVSNAVNSTGTLALTGAGVDFALAANGPTTATVTSGQSAAYALLYRPGAAVAGANVQLSCAGLPLYATCRLNPASLSIDGNVLPVVVTVATGVDPAASLRQQELALLLVPAGVAALRRRRVLAAVMLFGLVGAAGCGAGRTIPASSAPSSSSSLVTPAGSYAITVTATGSGLTRTVALTLTVQ